MTQALLFKRCSHLFLALQLSTLLYSNAIDRLIILTEAEPNPALQSQITRVETDFRHLFKVTDIYIIQDANLAESMSSTKALCREPNLTVVLALIFKENNGPSLAMVEELLGEIQSQIKILANAYAMKTLSDLSCGRHAIFDYARGEVRSRDTIETEKDKFPIIPVVGGGVLIGAGIILFTGGDDSGCMTVNPGWQLPTVLCSDASSLQLMITGTQGGAWTGSGVSANGVFNPSSGTQAITYTVGDGSCIRSLTQTIQVTSVNANWTVPSQPCVGETVILTPTSSGGTWTGSGIIQNPNGTASFSQNSPGTYNVTYSLMSGGCSDIVSHDITVTPDADASWTNPGSVCAGETIELMSTGTSGGQWTGSGIMDHGNGTASFLSQTSGSFSITYTTGNGECSASLTHEITVSPGPDASWVAPKSPGCVGQQFILLPSGTTGGTWSGSGVTDNGDGTGVFSQTMPGTYAITYTVTLGTCSSAATQDITVIDQVDASWILPGEVCTGTTRILVPSGTPGGTWSGQGISDQGDGTAVFTSNEAGSYAVTYTVGNGACEASSTNDINVIQSPDASWAPPSNALCTGESFELMSSGEQGGMWTGQGVTDHGNGTATFLQSTTGEYSVTYSVTMGPCSGSSTQTIVVVSQPDASWTPSSNVCSGDQVTLIPTGTTGGTWTGNGVMDLGNGTALFSPTEAGSYNIVYTIGQGTCEASLAQDINVFALPNAGWSIPTGVCSGQIIILSPAGKKGGAWTGDGVSDLGNGTAQFVQEKPGTYEVTYTVTAGPCTSMLTQSIDVMSQPDASWTPPTDVCAGQLVVLSPDGTAGGTWTGPGVTDLGNGTANFIQNNAGTYPITYTVGQGACQQLSIQDIIVNVAGDASWTPPSEVICPGAIVELVAAEGTWSGNGVTDLGGGLGQFQSFNPGTYGITLTVGSGTCTSSESHDVEVGDFDAPLIEIAASDMTVTCDVNGNETELQDWLDAHGGAEASDNCSNVVTWENDFVNFPFDCGMTGGAIVTFTAFDEAGNSSSTIGEFTIEDIDPPVFQGVPSDITVPCDNIPPPASVAAIDDCSGDADILFEEIPPGTSCPYEIIRMWTATDDCGNEMTAQQTITATDNAAPQPISMPHDTVINCPGPPQQCIPPPQPVQFTDNCDTNPTVTFTEEQQQMPGMLILIRCWTATDDCGNMSSQVCQQVIIFGMGENVQQESPPVVLLTISSPPTTDASYSDFTPFNADWEDPELIESLGDEPVHAYQVTIEPPVGIVLEIPLEANVSFMAGACLTNSELYHQYSANTGDVLFNGLLRQQVYYMGLRFVPTQAKQFFFTSGLQYTQQHFKNMQMNTGTRSIHSDSVLRNSHFSQTASAGMRFLLGDMGHWEIIAGYGSSGYRMLTGQMNIDIIKLLSSHRT